MHLSVALPQEVAIRSQGGSPGSRGATIRRRFSFRPEDRTRSVDRNVRPITINLTANGHVNYPVDGVIKEDKPTKAQASSIP